MKITDSLKERLFVMLLQREMDFLRRVGEVPDIKHSVTVANGDTIKITQTITEEGL